MKNKSFNLDAIKNVELLDKELDKLSPEEVFEAGFTAYTYAEGNLLKNTLNTTVETTCPINGSDDLIDISICYKTNVYGEFIEHHSFMTWLDSFKQRGMGLETTVVEIFDKVNKVCQPVELEVIGFVNTNNKLRNTCVRTKSND